MATVLNQPLIIGISSRALFNLDESHHVFEQEGVEAYAQYQIANEDNPLEPGPAFAMVKKLLGICHPQNQKRLVEIVLISRNSADTGLRIFNSIAYHQLEIERAVFTRGESPYRYVSALGSQLFLSTHTEDVSQALAAGIASATILPSNQLDNQSRQLRIAFDGDAVLFSDESERIFKQQGLDAFMLNEKKQAKNPLSGGPFRPFLSALHDIQQQFSIQQCPIRTALVTARSAPAHERVIRTLREWGVRIDEALFLGGLAKGKFLQAFGADFYFDDQQVHCDSSREHVATAHVPHGIANE